MLKFPNYCYFSYAKIFVMCNRKKIDVYKKIFTLKLQNSSKTLDQIFSVCLKSLVGYHYRNLCKTFILFQAGLGFLQDSAKNW